MKFENVSSPKSGHSMLIDFQMATIQTCGCEWLRGADFGGDRAAKVRCVSRSERTWW